MLSKDLNGMSKKTLSKNTNTMKYNASTNFSEMKLVRDYVEKTVAKKQAVQNNIDGNVLIPTVIDFSLKFPQMKLIDPKLIADQLCTDARTLPSIPLLNVVVAEYYLQKLFTNLNNIYENAPAFFEKHFISDPMGFEIYQKYYYLICFIKFLSDKLTDEQFQNSYKLEDINNWINARRDVNINYIIVGPTDNSIFDINFEEHYNALISSSTSMSDIVQYQQLTTAQTISEDVLNVKRILQTTPNVYFKNPDEAKKYTINIDSSKDVIVEIDKDNNLLFDCSYVNFGDTTDQNTSAKIDEIDTTPVTNTIDSRIATKKIERIFQMYSRVKVLECIVSADAFITSLDIFPKVFIVFQGVLCSERNVYNTVENNYFKIGGSFVKTNRGYEFKQDVDAITYKSTKTRVSAFKVFISVDPSGRNLIMPNEYPIKFTKFNVFQHPILVNDKVDDDKLNMVRIPNFSSTHNPYSNLNRVNNTRKPYELFTEIEQIENDSLFPKHNEQTTNDKPLAATHDIEYIDTSTATINGKYFRMINNIVCFKDPETGFDYTTPDLTWLKYKARENDICLINLKNYVAEQIKGIPLCSFMYSEFLSTIQNLHYNTDQYSLVTLNFRYDSYFNVLINNELYSIVPDDIDTSLFTKPITWSDLSKMQFTDVEYYKISPPSGNATYISVNRITGVVSEFQPGDTIQIDNNYYLIDRAFKDIEPFMTYKKLVPLLGEVTYTAYKLSTNPKYKNNTLKLYYNYYHKREYFMFDTTEWNVKLIINADKFINISIKDAFGYVVNSIFDWRVNNISITNNYFDDINALTTTSVTNYDSENNKITLKYCRFAVNKNNVYMIIINEKNIISQNATVKTAFVLDLNQANLYYATYDNTIDKLNKIIDEYMLDNDGFIVDKTVADLKLDEMTIVIQNTNAETHYNTELMNKFKEFVDDADPLYGNAYKAFKISNFDLKQYYWTKDIYINSILNTQFPVERGYHFLPTEELSFDSESNLIYRADIHGDYHILSNTYRINDNGIFEIGFNSSRKLGTNESIYVSRKGVNSYFYTPTNNNNVIEDELTFELKNGEGITNYYLTISINEDLEITSLKLCESGLLYTESGLICTEQIPIGVYNEGVSNNIPLYIDNHEIIINYSLNTTKRLVVINNISMSNVLNETYEYKIVNNIVMRRFVDTFIYSNRSERLVERNMFTMTIPNSIYAIHPYIKYVETNFVLPKRVNKSGEYITIINKTNQNLSTGVVNVYNNYNVQKNDLNKLNIAKRIGTNDDFIMESMDKNMILLGNVFKSAPMNDVAIINDDIYIVPKASKLMITLEFT